MEFPTDYKDGDKPVPPGTVVWYIPPGYEQEFRFVVTDWADPQDHPRPPSFPQPTLEEAYPDRVAYHLWPEGVPRKFGNRDQAMYWVRRTSFRMVEETER